MIFSMNRIALIKMALRTRTCGNPQDSPPSAGSRRAVSRWWLPCFAGERFAKPQREDFQQESVLAIGTALCLISFRSPTKPWIDHTSMEPTLLAEPLENRSEKADCIPLPRARSISMNGPISCRSAGARRCPNSFTTRWPRHAASVGLRLRLVGRVHTRPGGVPWRGGTAPTWPNPPLIATGVALGDVPQGCEICLWPGD